MESVAAGGAAGGGGAAVGKGLGGVVEAAKLEAPASRGTVLAAVLCCFVVMILFVDFGSAPPADRPADVSGNNGGGSAAVHYSHCSTYTANTNFLIDDMVCPDNTASSLDECYYTEHHNCGSTEGVWVSCASSTCEARLPPPPPAPREFTGVISSLRLVGEDGVSQATPQQGGILQAQVNGEWGYVCDDYFDSNLNAASVACRQLGYPGPATHCNAHIPNLLSDVDPYGLPFVLDDVHCGSPSLTTLQQCEGMVGRERENCGASEGIFLVCGTDRCPPPPPLAYPTGLRLVGGSNPGEGILEAALATSPNNWGPVCDDYFDQDGIAASVVCRQLGYPGGTAAKHCDVHVPFPNFILDDVHCPDANAMNLQECTYQVTHNCGVTEGIWIQCNADLPCNAPPPPPPSSSPSSAVAPPSARTAGPPIAGMRLAGSNFAGRLEVTYDGLTWGPVCDDWFDIDDHQVEVVCRQLGFLDEHGGQTGRGHSVWMRDGSNTGTNQIDILDNYPGR
eukprot:COSAG02_NODE_44_length_45948_cov_81.673493_27_plen_507_part_00